MAKLNVFHVMAVAGLLVFAESTAAQSGYIHLVGDQFKDEYGDDFFPMVMNYYIDCAWQYTANRPGPDPTATELTHCHIQRSSLYGMDGGFDYTDLLAGPAEILRDFHEIDNLGYNTVRFVMTPYKKPGLGFTVDFLKDFDDATVYQQLNFDPPYDPASNPVADWHFDNVLKVCSLANVVGLKVILICADKQELINGAPGSSQITDYANYLKELAKVIHDQDIRNLVAYEFFGEPSGSPIAHSKTDICEIADQWVNAIRQYDTDHMTTIGGIDIIADSFRDGWDPLLLPVDFANMHFYSDPKPFQLDLMGMNMTEILAQSTERYLDKAFIYSENIRKPYIIAETSFQAHDGVDYVFPVSVYGDESDMNDFIQATFPVIRDSRAAGYGWWDFQQKHWYPDPPNSDPTITLKMYIENHYGILNRGDPDDTDPLNGYHNSNVNLRKQGAQTFADWKTSPPAPSAPYVVPSTLDMNEVFFNPFGHPVNSTVIGGLFGTITGHVEDQFGDPLVHAVLNCSSWVGDMGTPTPDDDILYGYHAYTDDNGDFEVRAYDIAPTDDYYDAAPTKDRTVGVLKISSYGCGWHHYGLWPGSEGSIASDGTYVLHSMEREFDRTVDDEVVAIGTTEDFQAFATLTAIDLTIDGDHVSDGGQTEMVARYEVNLRPGFDAVEGSTVHIYTAPLSPDCSDIDAADLRSTTTATSMLQLASSASQERYIQLDFHASSVEFQVNVFPNPSQGTLSVVVLPEREGIRGTWRLLDQTGKEAMTDIFMTSHFNIVHAGIAPGVYTLTLDMEGSTLKRSVVLLNSH